jgi:hypothetical protein
MKKKQLQALLLFAAKNDARYYLNGIYADPAGYLVATDGRRLLYIKTEPGLNAIIPREAAEAAVKMAKKGQEIQLTANSIGQVTYTPVDGTFPDWRRVMPCGDDMQANPQCTFNWPYLTDAEKAFKLMGCEGTKLGFCANAAIYANDNAVAVVMGQRRRDTHLESYPKPQ